MMKEEYLQPACFRRMTFRYVVGIFRSAKDTNLYLRHRGIQYLARNWPALPVEKFISCLLLR